MAKHGKELSSETKSVIIKFIESGLRASEISKRLNIKVSIASIRMAFIMTLWIGNGAVLKSSSQWQLNEF